VSATSATKTFSGIFAQGNLNAPSLEWTDASHGFNLISNPYPSYLVWGNNINKNGLDANNTIWVWNGINYEVYVPSDNYVLKPTQAFHVQASGLGANVEFTDAARTCLPKKTLTNSIFRLQAQGNNLTDEVKIYSADYTAPSAKLISWNKQVPQLFFIEAEQNYALYATDQLQDKYELGFLCGTDGKYSINLTDLGFVNSVVYLEDKAKGILHDFSLGKYSFDYKKGDAENRFTLHFKLTTTAVNEIENAFASIYSAENSIHIHLKDSENTVISVFDLSGRKLRELKTSQTQNQLFGFEKGIYVVKIENTSGSQTAKVFVK
jgi:hypothetical protein